MSDDLETQEQQSEEDKSLWDIMELSPSSGDEYEDEQEEQDAEIAKADKLEKKLSAKMENMQKKFETNMLRDKIEKFQESSDELELDLFKTVAADVKSIEDFDRVVATVKRQSVQLRETAEKYRAQLEEEAAKQTASAWGTGPIGAPSIKRTPDDEEQLMERIKNGDAEAAFEAIVGSDLPKRR